MHATLPTHVLALAPDSLATIGQIDPDGLAELWSGQSHGEVTHTQNSMLTL